MLTSSQLFLFLIFLSALTVVIGDSIIKHISTGSTVLASLKNPWMLLVYLLYFTQILFAIYIFIKGGELAVYANFYIIYYSILSVIFGVMFFKEGLSPTQITGIILAIVGSILINH